jgi:hypothetical protein
MIHNHHLTLKPMKLKTRRYISNELNINSHDLLLLFLERGTQIYQETETQQLSYMIKYGLSKTMWELITYIFTRLSSIKNGCSPLQSSLPGIVCCATLVQSNTKASVSESFDMNSHFIYVCLQPPYIYYPCKKIPGLITTIKSVLYR